MLNLILGYGIHLLASIVVANAMRLPNSQRSYTRQNPEKRKEWAMNCSSRLSRHL